MKTENNILISGDLNQFRTEQILNQIRESPVEFAERLDEIHSRKPEEYLNELLERHQCSKSQLVTRSCLSKSFVYQILKGERMPGRDIILRMCFAIRADVDETQRLLTLEEKGVLYPRVKRDAAILCCLEAGKSLEYTNLFLKEHGETPLL